MTGNGLTALSLRGSGGRHEHGDRSGRKASAGAISRRTVDDRRSFKSPRGIGTQPAMPPSSPGNGRGSGAAMEQSPPSTPARTPARQRMRSTVAVERRPPEGTPSAAGDGGRAGIGISFGVTARGDVFITGLSSGGPAQLCGRIRRGDQLLSVDGQTVHGWEVGSANSRVLLVTTPLTG